MLSGCPPLRKIEHTNNATHKNLRIHKTQFTELFSRNQNINFKRKFEKLKEKSAKMQ
jgi:hypothetical protein